MCSWRVLRSPAAAPPVRYLCPERRRSRAFDACRLGGAYGLSASALDRSDRRACAGRRDAACNDTSVPVLDPGRGQTKTGRLWVAVRDERSWGSPVPPAVYYQYSPDRRAARAEALLRGCHGYLHADAYAGFNGLYEANTRGGMPLIEVGCWAHARRKIYEVHDATKSPRAKELLKGDRQPVRDRGADQGPQRTRALGRSPAAIGAVAHEP